MAFCSYIEKINDYECLGDSLVKINQNFSKLNSAACEIPKIVNGPGIDIDNYTTEQDQNTILVAAKNSFEYRSKFDSYNSEAFLTTVQLNDGTTLEVTEFPYVAVYEANKPTATFTTIVQADVYPRVTLYWLASGSNMLSAHPLNDSLSDEIRGNTWFNGTVSCTLSTTRGLCVGGSFTNCGGFLAQKFALIDTTVDIRGTLITNSVFPTLPFFGNVGDIRCIKTTNITINSVVNELFIFGGSYENIGTSGRGLLIYNATTGISYSWYVNGEVNDLEVVDNNLYVGGHFDYINYGNTSSSRASGQRIYTNGFVKIALPSVLAGLAISSITDFSTFLSRNATIYSFASYGYYLYIGGEFEIKENDELQHKNLYSIDLTPLSITDPKYKDPKTPIARWKTVVDGPVYTLYIDNLIDEGSSVYLYVGGHFCKAYSNPQYHLDPRNKTKDVEFYNACSFQLTNLSTIKAIPSIVNTWKPEFNGPVLRFLYRTNSEQSLTPIGDEPTVQINNYIYCYGQYSSIATEAISHLGAVVKASVSFKSGTPFVPWNPGIQNGPSVPNKALIDSATGIIVGGNFTQALDKYRYNLAEISPISETLLINPSTIAWDCGMQVVSPRNLLSIDQFASTTSRVSTTPFQFDQLNATVFEPFVEGFKQMTPGQPIRIFIRRPGNSCHTDDTFKQKAYVVGCKIDFNQRCGNT